jgi:uncharacterized protein YPO0396
MNNPDLTLFSKDAQSAGFRLQRFEVYNWGAFHQTVYVMPIEGENALLTGANGAGKTTLVDAIITLLAPSPERYYNQSAGFADQKRTRKLEDYVRGVYGHSEKGREQLRDIAGEQSAYTVLLGVFRNTDTGQNITLAQVYWFRQGELQKKYYVAGADLNIAQHFVFQGDIRKLTTQLSKSYKVTGFDTFSDYANYMQPKLGMRYNEKGRSAAGRMKPLQLLAKTAGIKVLGNLDAFIREHMLDEVQLDAQFDQLKKEFSDVAETQQMLDKARKQEELLLPMFDKNTERLKNEAELQRKERVRAAIRPFFARYHTELLETEMSSLQSKLERNTEQILQWNERNLYLSDEEFQLKTQLNQSEVGRRLAELTKQYQELERSRTERQKEASRYAEIAQSVGLQDDVDAAMFFAQRAELQAKANEFLEQKDREIQKRDALVYQESQLKIEVKQLSESLESLKARENNLPHEYVQLRERMAADLGIKPKLLPFVAELLQLKATEKDQWQHGIEKLFGPFSMQLLVSKQHLKQVIGWVRSQNTGTLLRMTEAEENAAEAILADQNPQVAANKVEVKIDSVYAEWLKSELYKRFPHVCTSNSAEYEKRKQALTPEGLFKSDKFHQKDDRRHRRTNYVMGWDNQESVYRLEQELGEKQREISEFRDRMKPISAVMDGLDRQLANLQRLKDFELFSRIDHKSLELEMLNCQTQIQDLNKNTDGHKAIQKQLDKVQDELRKVLTNRDLASQTEGSLRKELQQRKIEYENTRNEAFDGQELDIHRVAVEQFVGEIPVLDLQTVTRKKEEIESRIVRESVGHRELKNQLEKELERMMSAFKNPKKDVLDAFPSWPNDTDAMGNPIIENIGTYLNLLETIQNDQLPVLAERFEARTSQDMSKSILLFERALTAQFDDHLDNIKNMNLALRALPYTTDTYLQIVTEQNLLRGRIGEFNQMLKQCRYDPQVFKFAQPQQQREILREVVGHIGALIQKLDNQPDWRKEVTDVRNWLTFRTQLVYQATDVPVAGTLQDSTGGKSGGEQAKLTYTVLAAALTYQFNITNERNANSFRFIVVDEAFSKLDPENSAYLLNLLSGLKFQMVIITPNNFSKANEDMMHHLIYIQKTSENPPISAAFHWTKMAWMESRKL